jgi:hypothetical protein
VALRQGEAKEEDEGTTGPPVDLLMFVFNLSLLDGHLLLRFQSTSDFVAYCDLPRISAHLGVTHE